MDYKNDKDYIKHDKDGNVFIKVSDSMWVPESSESDMSERDELDMKRYSKPKIYVSGCIINILFPMLCIGIFVYVFKMIYEYSYIQMIVLYISFCLLYLFIRVKDIAIFAIKIYQNKAPMSIRGACNFTPTCSDYMILSIQKYGLIIGVIKGLNRIKRCRGQKEEDWP